MNTSRPTVATTNGIRIQVVTRFVPEHSAPRQREYLFSYEVSISNVGEETAQLVSRRWIITNAEGHVKEVEGPGVVGEQPVLEPGMSFEYRSFCPLDTAFGTMHGTYTMVRPDGESFEAEIAPFTLVAPHAVN